MLSHPAGCMLQQFPHMLLSVRASNSVEVLQSISVEQLMFYNLSAECNLGICPLDGASLISAALGQPEQCSLYQP